MSGPSWTVRDIGDGMGAFRDFLEHELIPRFPSRWMRQRSDAAVLEIGTQRWALTCDGFLVDPPFFPGGDIGSMAVCGTANDLLTAGARPQFLLMSLVVSQHASQAMLVDVLDSIRVRADACGAVLIGGDTKTISQPDPVLMISMTGLGAVQRVGPDLGFEQVGGGDRILVTGPVGAHSVAVLSVREGLGFEQQVSSDCADVGALIWDVVRTHPGVRALRDLTRGGLTGVLEELAHFTRRDVLVEAAAVPVQQDVAMCCEMLGISPLGLTNEGCMAMVVQASDADDVLAEVRRRGCPEASLVGRVGEPDDGGGRVLMDKGGRLSIVPEAPALGLPRLC